MAQILLLNGPNLNLLGRREPGIYGSASLSQIVANLQHRAQQAGHQLQHFQSNHEGALVDRIHLALDEGIEHILINPGALTHTSIALRDALLGVKIAFYEIHLSNIHAREAFRHTSYLSDIAQGVIVGLGPLGYELALEATLKKLSQHQ